MRHPLLMITVVLICGMITGCFVYLPPAIVFGTIVVTLMICAFEIIRRRLERGPRPQGSLLFLAIFLIGLYQQNQVVARQARAKDRIALLEQCGEVALSGRLCDDPDLRDKYGFLVLDQVEARHGDQHVGVPGKVLIRLVGPAFACVAANPPAWRDRIEARGQVECVEGGRNPGLPDYFDYLQSNSIHGMLSVRYPVYLRDDSALHRSLLAQARYAGQHLRRQCSDVIANRMPRESAALMQSICFGRAHRLEPDLKRDFMKTGLMHVFAVSGLHVGILGLLAFGLFRALRAGPRTAAALTLIILVGYLLMVGPRPPVVRAVIMAAALTMSLLMKTRVEPLSSLSLAALAILIGSPEQLAQTGFQLSFLAVIGILLFTPFFYSWLSWKPPEEETLWQMRRRRAWNHLGPGVLSASLGVLLMIAPIIAIRFHFIPLVALLLNIVVYPLVALIMALGVLTLLCSLISPGLAELASATGDQVCRLLTTVIESGADWPLAYSHQSAWPWWAVAGYYIMILGTITARRVDMHERMPFDLPRRNAALLLQTAGLLCFVIWMPVFARPPLNVTVTFFDIGQGDSALVEFPNGRVVLIDAGPPSAARRVLLPYFISRGIDRLDLVIVSHDDLDHYGGMLDIVREIPIGHLLIPRDPDVSEKFLRMLDVAHQRCVDVHEVCAPAVIPDFCAAEFEFLHPVDNPVENVSLEDNDISLVARMKYFDRVFLFTGDLTIESETRLLSRCWDVSADVLKVSHHGSRNGSSRNFIKAVNPVCAVVSCGRDNSFGHPARETLQRFADVGIKLFRTDKRGAIVVHTNGRNLEINTQFQEDNEYETTGSMLDVDYAHDRLRATTATGL